MITIKLVSGTHEFECDLPEIPPVGVQFRAKGYALDNEHPNIITGKIQRINSIDYIENSATATCDVLEIDK